MLAEEWGAPWGSSYGGPLGKISGIPAFAASDASDVDGYQVPLGLWAGFGYDRPHLTFTSVKSYKNDYSGVYAEYKDTKRAKGFTLSGDSIKKSGLTFGTKKAGNTFSGNYAEYKAPVVKRVRDYGLSSRRLTDILPLDNKKSGMFTKSLRSRDLGNLYNL